MICEECKKRGKTWKGEDPTCAFESGIFSSENWNCATMNKLRHIVDEKEFEKHNNMDCYLAVIPLEESGWIILSWYKRRGRTPTARYMIDDIDQLLTLEDATRAINQYQDLFKEPEE